MAVCPLCGTEHASVLVSESTHSFVTLYRRTYQIDVAPLFRKLDRVDLLRCDHCDLRFFSPAVGGEESFYNALQGYDWYYQSNKPEFVRAASRINGSKRVLDVGAGRGAFAQHLQNGAAYVGLDFSVQAKAMALQSGIQIRNESVQDHAHASAGQYDLVCSFQVLEHVADVAAFVRACAQCVKPGGQAVVFGALGRFFLTL